MTFPMTLGNISNAMTFPGLEFLFQNSTTFPSFHDLHEPCNSQGFGGGDLEKTNSQHLPLHCPLHLPLLPPRLPLELLANWTEKQQHAIDKYTNTH